MLSVCTRRDCCSEDTGVASAQSIDVGVCVGGGSTGDAGRGDSRCARDGQPTNASLALIVVVVQREFNTIISLHETSTLNVSSTPSSHCTRRPCCSDTRVATPAKFCCPSTCTGYLSTLWVKKKQDTKLLAITSLIIIRLSIFFSLADSVINLRQILV